MSSMDQRHVLACGGCTGVGENDLKVPPIERLTDGFEQLTPPAHAMKVLDLFSLDPSNLTKLQKSDPGIRVFKDETGKWLPIDSGVPAINVDNDGYILYREVDRGDQVDYSAVFYQSLKRTAISFSQELMQESEGSCHYVADTQRISPLLFVSKSRFVAAFSPTISSEDLAVLLNDSPLKKLNY